MSRANHNLVLLIHYSGGPVEEEYLIRELVNHVVTEDAFSRSHELAMRNRISRKRSKLLSAYRKRRLHAFQFFIGLN